MIQDTPRTDDAEYLSYDSEPPQSLEMVDVAFARQLERELNAATSEIARLTSKVAQLYRGAEELKQRINRLEEENDALRADLLLWSEKEVKL
jgi:phage shock protein A